MREQPARATWSEHDSAVWHSCDIAARLLAGTLHERAPVPSPFPPQLRPDETLVAHGEYALSTFRPVGDGSWSRDGGFFLATGGPMVAMSAGVALARAAGNRRRAEQAWRDAQPRWVVDERGGLWVSTAGFYRHTAVGLSPWSWHDVRAATLVGPGAVQLHARTGAGEASWVVTSVWAELLFVLWALAVHPDHPGLQAGAWLPPGWRERCIGAGYGDPLAAAGVAAARYLPRGGSSSRRRR